MSDLSRSIAIKPIIKYPSEAQVGKTYLMTIDLQTEEEFEWQYEEEYSVYCKVDSEMFSSKLVGEPVIVLHRFGGSYGEVKILLTPLKNEEAAIIKVALFNRLGVVFNIINLEEIKIISPKTNSVEEKTETNLITFPKNNIKRYTGNNESIHNDSGITLEKLPMTYTGLLDDTMFRYSNEYLSEDFFNKIIAKNIFFGGGIYINDGYLVNHPIARQQLYTENSLLRTMISVGFIRILTRASSSESLSQMPMMMAQQGNASFKQLVESPEWTDFSPILSQIAQTVFFNNNARIWPNRNMSVGFTKLMRDRAFSDEEPSKLGIANVSRDEWLRIRDDFLARNPESSGSRDKLEKSALNILKENRANPKLAMAEVMAVGNQAYHYNFGLALNLEEKNGVVVDTIIGSAFDELLQTRLIEREQLYNIPNLRLPRNLPFDRGDLFLDFISPSTSIGLAKLNYLTSLRSILSGVDLDISSLKSNLFEAAEEYLMRIIDLLSPTFGRYEIERIFDESFTLAVRKLSDDKTKPSAPTAGLAIEIYDMVSQKGHQIITERFQIKDNFERLSIDNKVYQFGDFRPCIASIAFDEKSSTEFIEDIPPAPYF